MKKSLTLSLAAITGLALATSAAHADKLTYYCSAQEDWCQLMARSFEEATGNRCRHDAKVVGRNLRPDQGRSVESQGLMSGGAERVTRTCRRQKKG